MADAGRGRGGFRGQGRGGRGRGSSRGRGNSGPQQGYEANYDASRSQSQHNQRGGRQVHDRPPLRIAGRPTQHSRDQPDDDNGEMNAHLSERLIAPSRPSNTNASGQWSAYPRNPLVEKFEKFDNSNLPGWRSLPEVPNSKELLNSEVDLPTNEIAAPWDSVDEYLGAHYELLREDSFSPLRDAVGLFRANPHMDDSHDCCIYDNTRIVGITFAMSLGMCTKVSFSTGRARKKIRWAFSKRLCPGTVVALSSDKFEKVIYIATVAARPLAALDMEDGSSEVDLLFERDDLEIDPTKAWVMIESRRSYYEACKHTLKALQRMNDSNFPLKNALMLQDKKIGIPQYLQDRPDVDLNPCFHDNPDKDLLNSVNIINNFPRKTDITTSMDESQMEAVKRILTKELAIVQGPPGCGKTFVSVKALAALIKNKRHKDPPIIVACQTNHALDQLLRHVVEFEPNLIRLGGRTQDTDKIKERTLYNTRKENTVEVQGSAHGRLQKSLRQLEGKSREILQCIAGDILDPKVLLKHGLMSAAQCKKFISMEDGWVGGGPVSSAMEMWLGSWISPIKKDRSMIIDVDYEDDDIAMEELKDLEAEFKGDDDFDDSLRGFFLETRRTKQVVNPPGVAKSQVEAAMRKEDPFQINDQVRPAVYRAWEQGLMAKVKEKMKEIMKQYSQLVIDFRIARWEKDSVHLERAKIIGMTTTGMSKYRSLVASIQPKVCLIEEAAETLEAPLIVACYPSLEHLILVGDHKQLRGHCNVAELDHEPYNLGISMFERLVKNGVNYTMLTKQRRMRPEIRQILAPIYDKLEDDDQVLNKPPIPGMGNLNVYFYSHNKPEAQDEMSKKNPHEAAMVVGLCAYLVNNGISQSDITILTFYTGQQRELRARLRKHPRLNTGIEKIRVATVDSFQGEENEVIILSLCRSNSTGSIGFLGIENRVCVALSRAKRGFYMFGNATLMSRASALWWDVLQILNTRAPTAISATLPVTCQRHNKVTYMEMEVDWINNEGGCSTQCGDRLQCGHRCTLACHPYDHTVVKCVVQCNKRLQCGHFCERQCWEECKCHGCSNRRNNDDFNGQVDQLSSDMDRYDIGERPMRQPQGPPIGRGGNPPVAPIYNRGPGNPWGTRPPQPPRGLDSAVYPSLHDTNSWGAQPGGHQPGGHQPGGHQPGGHQPGFRGPGPVPQAQVNTGGAWNTNRAPNFQGVRTVPVLPQNPAPGPWTRVNPTPAEIPRGNPPQAQAQRQDSVSSYPPTFDGASSATSEISVMVQQLLAGELPVEDLIKFDDVPVIKHNMTIDDANEVLVPTSASNKLSTTSPPPPALMD